MCTSNACPDSRFLAPSYDLGDLFDKAIAAHWLETPSLRFLPENRYDRSVFPTTGQYDWFSGQLLYCVMRHRKPQRIIEIAAGSGYSTLFMAMALKANGTGLIDTFEMDRRTAATAQRNFERYGVSQFINLHVGDARVTSSRIEREGAKILFLDSLHTEAFARWFIEAFVLGAEPDALFHMHDIMPLHARVRMCGGPPFIRVGSRIARLRRHLRDLIKGKAPANEVIPPTIYPPSVPGQLPTYNGNHTTETLLGNRLAEIMSPKHYVYCHELADHYPMLEPRRYDPQAIGRQDAAGQPFEWNESLWAFAGPQAEAYRKINLVGHSAGCV